MTKIYTFLKSLCIFHTPDTHLVYFGQNPGPLEDQNLHLLEITLSFPYPWHPLSLVGLALARDRGDNDIGGWSLARDCDTGGWLLAKQWEIHERSTANVGAHAIQKANQHTNIPSPTSKKHTKLTNSTQHTNTKTSKTLGTPSKKALKINSLLRSILGIWSKVNKKLTNLR